MSLSDYLLGATELAVIAAALWIGAYYMRAWIVPGWNGAPARLAEVILAISGLILISEVIGVVGLFEPGILLVACVVVGFAAALLARAGIARAAPAHAIPSPRAAAWMLPVGVLASLLVIAHWGVGVQESLDVGMYRQDTTWYHMSFSARFVQDAQVGELHFTDPLRLTAWFYPLNSELLHSVGILAFDTDFLSPLVNVGWLALSLLAGWCIGRPYGLGAVTMLGAAVVLGSEMMVHVQAGNAPSDTPSLFFLMAAVAFLIDGDAASRLGRMIRPAEEGMAGPDPDEDMITPQPAATEPAAAGEEPRRRRWRWRWRWPVVSLEGGPLFLAALAAGLALGTKITLLAMLGALTVVLVVLAERGRRLLTGGIWVAGMALTAGFWFIRNVIHATNPLPWIQKAGPIDLPNPDQLSYYPRPEHSVAEYLDTPFEAVELFAPRLNDTLGPLWPAVLIVAGAALVVTVFAGRSPLLRAMGAIGIFAAMAYVFTPVTASGVIGDPDGFSANLRYLAPALLIGFTLLPLIPRLAGRGAIAVSIGYAALLIVASIDSPTWDPDAIATGIVLAVMLGLVPVALIFASRRGVPALAVGAAVVAVVAAFVILGRGEQKDYLRDRYDIALAPELDNPGFRSDPEWIPVQEWAKGLEDKRIAVVGDAAAFGQYIFYGDDLSNHVQYLGRSGNNGTYLPISTCQRWRRHLSAGDYDYLVVTPTREQGELPEPLETVWTRSDRATREIIRTSHDGVKGASVFRINRSLSPARCARLGKRARFEETF